MHPQPTSAQITFALVISNDILITGGELRNGVNGFLKSYATDSVQFSQQILDKKHAGPTNEFIRWQI